jgi:prolipoprotein diacylglyceryl transferase
MFTSIRWDIDPEIFSLGSISIRYYGLMFVTGLYLGLIILQQIYKREKLPEKDLEKLMIYILIGIIAGARLGHCLFYEPAYYLNHPLEMLLPIEALDSGGYKFSGYQGLASHGGALGIVLAILFFSRKTHTRILTNFDHLAIATPLTGFFIRFGNLMNSEIIGNPSNVSWAFVFVRADQLPRHPSQLYEALAYLAIFALVWYLYARKSTKFQEGRLFGLVLVLIFVARFLIEFTKKNQVSFEDNLSLNMGQWLSIPFIIAGTWLFLRTDRKAEKPVAGNEAMG